jgi:hypothetical protein
VSSATVVGIQISDTSWRSVEDLFAQCGLNRLDSFSDSVSTVRDVKSRIPIVPGVTWFMVGKSEPDLDYVYDVSALIGKNENHIVRVFQEVSGECALVVCFIDLGSRLVKHASVVDVVGLLRAIAECTRLGAPAESTQFECRWTGRTFGSEVPAQSDVAPDGSPSVAPPGAPSSALRVNAGIGPAPESDEGDDKNGQ